MAFDARERVSDLVLRNGLFFLKNSVRVSQKKLSRNMEPSRKFADIIVLEGGRNLVALEMIMQRIQAHIDAP